MRIERGLAAIFSGRNIGSLSWISALVVLLLCGCSRGAGTRPAPDGPRPNIIFILVDTLRADRLGAYQPDRRLTPTMDSIARDGVVFEEAIAQAPWTLPSVASIFSGFYPSVHKATDYKTVMGDEEEEGGTVRVFGDQFHTLAEALQTAGYETAAFVANPFVIPRYGFKQGFEHFDARKTGNTVRGAAINKSLGQWLPKRNTDKPLFLYMHYMEPHAPYRAAKMIVQPLVRAVAQRPDKRLLSEYERDKHVNFFRKSVKPYKDDPLHKRLRRYADYWAARYDAGVQQADGVLSDLRRRLHEAGLWSESYVILVSDHGEGLGDHEYWGHGTRAWQSQLHVPMVLRWPGTLPAGMRVAQRVRVFDIFPTILDQLGLPPVEDMQAKSLTPFIQGVQTEPRLAFAEAVNTMPGLKAALYGDWKMHLDTASNPQAVELYHLADDPSELQNLTRANPEQLRSILAMVDAQMLENATLGEDIEVQDAEVSAEGVEALRALGYTGDLAEYDEAEDEPTSQPATSQPSETHIDPP